MAKINKDEMKSIDNILRLLDSSNLESARCFGIPDVHTFKEWHQRSLWFEDPDMIRSSLYYLFQPLTDILIDNKVLEHNRQSALELYDVMVSGTKRFLKSYYLGRADIDHYSSLMREIKPSVNKIADSIYHARCRNMDDYECINPIDAKMFFRSFGKMILDKELFMPDYLVCVACSASEFTMAASGIFDVPCGFVRKSGLMGDSVGRIIPEHEERLIEGIKDKNVYVIDDFVSTGDSVLSVMSRVMQYNPRNILGLSVHNTPSKKLLDGLEPLYSGYCLHVYGLRNTDQRIV